MHQVKGNLFTGISSIPIPAVLEIDQNGQLSLISNGTSPTIPISDMSISSRLGQTARYIHLKDHGKFETLDNSGVDYLKSLLTPTSSTTTLHKLESNLPLIGIALIVTVMVVFAIMRWGVPTLSDAIVQRLPDKTADVLETSILEHVESRWFKESKLSENRQLQLHSLFTDVARSLNVDHKQYTFKLRDAENSIGANALAFPSGTIVMTDQLVAMVDSDEQLAGVLAHEIGHLEENHSLRQLVRGSIVTFLVAWITGDISGASGLLITTPAVLIELQYSRDFERQADEYSLKYLNCDPVKLEHMVNFYTLQNNIKEHNEQSNAKHKHQSKDTSINQTEFDFLSTHPGSDSRAQLFLDYYDKFCLAK